MGRRLAGAVVALFAAAASLAGGSPASAATEVGNDCPATAGLGNVSFVQLAEAPGNPLPMTVPTAGVVTGWKVTKEFHTLEPFELKLKVYRATSAPSEFEVVAESSLEVIEEGPNVFGTRIPVKPGDRFGLYGPLPAGAVNCVSQFAQDVAGVVVGDVPPGSTESFTTEKSNYRVAVSALVEPDADQDGYGDETQDRCPRTAAIQLVPCPVLHISSFGLAGKGSALLLVAADGIVPVTASGTVRLPGRARKRARAQAQLLLSAPTQTVASGQLGRFVLPFPKPLLSALRRLPRNRFLRLSLEASATDLAGAETTSTSVVRIKGQATRRR